MDFFCFRDVNEMCVMSEIDVTLFSIQSDNFQLAVEISNHKDKY